MPENLLPIESLKPLVGKERKGGGGNNVATTTSVSRINQKRPEKIGLLYSTKNF